MLYLLHLNFTTFRKICNIFPIIFTYIVNKWEVIDMTTEYLSFKQAMHYMGFNSYDSLRKAVKDGLPVI